MIERSNENTQLHIKNMLDALTVLGTYAAGDFTPVLRNYPGKTVVTKEIMDRTRNSLLHLLTDTEMLTKAAVAGQLATRADASQHQGDFRKIIQGVNDTLDAFLKPVRAAADVLHLIAQGDLTVRVQGDFQGDHAAIRDNINKMAEDLSRSMTAVGENVNTLAMASSELAAISTQMGSKAEESVAQINVVSAASEQVSKNGQTVATGIEEMSASIKEIAKNASEAAQVAGSAVAVAQSADTKVTKLGESSNQIGQVIKVITSIAEQTNLLALNATIEAARAGEAGKGFAVVANEVKELAKETAKATEDISLKIQTIQQDTTEAIAAIREIGEVIGRINNISSTIASAVEEQTATTNEISRNVAEAAQGSTEISRNITAVAEIARSTSEGVEKTQRSSQELANLASELARLVGQFQYEQNTSPRSRGVAPSAGHRARPAGPAPFKETGRQVAAVGRW